jgi:hypothetical protein
MLPVVRKVVTPAARYISGNETGCSTTRISFGVYRELSSVNKVVSKYCAFR